MRRKFPFIVLLVILSLTLWYGSTLMRRANDVPSAVSTNETMHGPSTSSVSAPRLLPRRIIDGLAQHESAKADWRTPIDFYGRVLDENDMPVAGAIVHFGWTDLSKEGRSQANGVSEGDGTFALRGKEGKFLSVKVEKTGYYTSKSNRYSFFYAGENVNFVPNPHRPVVFYLRKAGAAEPLVAGRRTYQVPRDGSTIEIDLMTGNRVSPGKGNLQVQGWTGSSQTNGRGRFDWRCRLVVPMGGLLLSTNEFAFHAPDMGYEPSDQIEMLAGNEAWRRDIERNYFFRLSDGHYGRMSFRMIAGGDNFCIVDYFLNPSGSRNLEFDPTVQPKQTEFY